MKKLLILIAVFMSPLTFAQLDGKGLICIPPYDPPNLLTLEAFLFEEDKFYEYDLWTVKDQVEVEIRAPLCKISTTLILKKSKS
jgi:hypothetical protein